MPVFRVNTAFPDRVYAVLFALVVNLWSTMKGAAALKTTSV